MLPRFLPSLCAQNETRSQRNATEKWQKSEQTLSRHCTAKEKGTKKSSPFFKKLSPKRQLCRTSPPTRSPTRKAWLSFRLSRFPRFAIFFNRSVPATCISRSRCSSGSSVPFLHFLSHTYLSPVTPLQFRDHWRIDRPSFNPRCNFSTSHPLHADFPFCQPSCAHPFPCRGIVLRTRNVGRRVCIHLRNG